MRLTTIALLSLALGGCAADASRNAEIDASHCRAAGLKPDSDAFEKCRASRDAERLRQTRSVLNAIPIRGFGP